MSGALVWLLVLWLPLAALAAWASLAIQRQWRLYQMQKWAARYWLWAAEAAREGKQFGYSSQSAPQYTAQAEHLDRHVRLARERDRTVTDGDPGAL